MEVQWIRRGHPLTLVGHDLSPHLGLVPHAEDSDLRRQLTDLDLNLPANGVENCVDVNFQNGRSCLVASLVGCDHVRTAQDDVDGRSVARAVTHAIRTVSRRIRGTKNGDGRRSKSDSQMQRPRVTADDADRVAQKRHELIE